MDEFTVTILPSDGSFTPFKVECDLCGYVVFSGTKDASRAKQLAQTVISRHLRQHAPGQALDLDISWSLDADCTVCGDGGHVRTDSDLEHLVCLDCHTTWTLEGTHGERADPASRG